jgi:hypothetical protein
MNADLAAFFTEEGFRQFLAQPYSGPIIANVFFVLVSLAMRVRFSTVLILLAGGAICSAAAVAISQPILRWVVSGLFGGTVLFLVFSNESRP